MPQRVPMRCLLSALLNTRLAARRHGAACGHVRLGCWRTAGGTGHSANRVLARSMPTYWYRFRPFRCSDCWWSPTPDLSTAPPTRPRRHRGRWAPMTEDGAEPESLPLDPPASSRLTNSRATRHHGRHARGPPEAQSVSNRPVSLEDAAHAVSCSRPRPRTQTLVGVVLGSFAVYLFGRLVAAIR
jgi:hypothetical protein